MMGLFDRAYSLVINDVTDKANQNLSHTFPDQTSAEIATAVTAARALVDYAEHCANMIRKGKLENAEALKEIKRAHPGFSDETYGFALNNGFFLTR